MSTQCNIRFDDNDHEVLEELSKILKLTRTSDLVRFSLRQTLLQIRREQTLVQSA